MRRKLMAGLGLLVVEVAACAEESPTEVGGDLMGPGVRTYEVTLDASGFLVADTTFDNIGDLVDAPFRLAAHQFDGELEARTLFSIVRPTTISYLVGGDLVIDTIAPVGGRLTLVIDTLASTPQPLEVEVIQVTEEWAPEVATWAVRTEEDGVAQPWATPGGTAGELVATATWAAGDTIRIELDSATVAVWDDSVVASMGGMIRLATPGARMFIQSMTFRYDMVSVTRDTAVVVGGVEDSKIIVTPEDVAPPAGVLRVGGLPAWRSLVRFRPLADLQVPCGPGQPPGCSVRLGDATVNHASLLLHPVPAGPRRPERSIRLEGRAVLLGPNIPLIRSPLTPPLGPPTELLPRDLFAESEPNGEETVVPLPITTFLQLHLHPPPEIPVPEWLALTAAGEQSQFGYGAFGGLGSERPPRLRLWLSVTEGVLVR
jgi:hypothetical protein